MNPENALDGVKDEVRVRFAIEGLDEDGWYPMSSMDVLK